MLQRNMMKCNCHRLKYLVLYYKRVILSRLVYYITRACECNMIYCEGQYSSILVSPDFFATCIEYNSTILFISHLLVCKYRFTRNLSSAYQALRRQNGMQYWSRYNIFNSFGNALLFRYIYKGRLVKISENIALLFYWLIWLMFGVLAPLSTIFQLYHGDQFYWWWRKPGVSGENNRPHGPWASNCY
jgi:hypothetical protein